MAVAPISQPLAPGISAVDYSPWSQAAQARSATPGILGYVPIDVPMELAMHEGANKYENYVRAWPDLLDHYLNRIPENTKSMADWGQEHWLTSGSKDTDPSMETWRGRGMWGDTPLPRTALGPGRFQASRHLPAMSGAYDPRADITSTSTISGGLPQPDVEGYKYEYPVFEWGGNEMPEYAYAGHTTADIGEYPYYPYMPYGGEAARSRNDRILVGQRLIPV